MTSPEPATPRRPITVDDLYAIRLVADPNISPDGSTVAYVITTVEREKNGYRSNIWRVAADGSGTPSRFTSGTGKDTSPRWSPDGNWLAFLSDRSGSNQLWVLPASGGEATRLTDGPDGPADIAWSADSQAIIFSRKLPAGAAPDSDVRVITTLRYRFDGEGFLDGRRRQVFRVAVDGSGDLPTAEQLTDGDWDNAQPAISADGASLAVASNRDDDRDDSTFSDIWVHDLSGGAAPRKVTPGGGVYGAPAWSPNGTLAWVGHSEAKPWGNVTLDDIQLWDAASDEIRGLLGSYEREPGGAAISDMKYAAPNPKPIWNATSDALYSLISDRGSVTVSSIATAGGAPTVLAGADTEVHSVTVANDGTLAFAASTMQLPAEVFVQQPGGGSLQITHANADFLASVELGQVEEITFESDPGVELHGWIVRPANFDASQQYPTLINVHGGPHGMYGLGFFHEFHVQAARGYIVVYTNPRGSSGYGQSFVAGTHADWGGADWRDISAATDYAAALPEVDTDRIGIIGGSYGGYMVNWAVGQTTRYRAAVTQRSTANRISLYGTSDYNMLYNDWEYGGDPYTNAAFYLERSPLTYVRNVETPVLIVHSENDLRCPISQGEEFFVALKKLGKTVEMVRFPNESHGLNRTGQPKHRVEHMERSIYWFDRFMPASAAATE